MVRVGEGGGGCESVGVSHVVGGSRVLLHIQTWPRAHSTRKLSGPTPPKENVGQERLKPKTPSIRLTLSGTRRAVGASMPASVSSAISGHTAERS